MIKERGNYDIAYKHDCEETLLNIPFFFNMTTRQYSYKKKKTPGGGFKWAALGLFPLLGVQPTDAL